MPGYAQTNRFILSSATVMLGAQNALFNLTGANAIGLVKNVNITSDPQEIELGQGIQNDIVASVRTQDTVRVSMEVYEFTAKNLAYAAGLDASTGYTETSNTFPVAANVTAGANVITVTGDATGEITAGTWIKVYQNLDPSNVYVGKVVTATFSSPDTTITLDTGFTFPEDITAGGHVTKTELITLGGQSTQPLLSCKIFGFTPQDNRPFTVLFPKVKVTRGFNLSFSPENFSNMPFEIMPYALVSTDPFYSEFGSRKGLLYPGA